MRKLVIAGIVAVIAAMSIAACGGHSAKVPTSAANTKVENQAQAVITGCVDKVSIFKLISKAGRKTVVSCLESQVPPAKRAGFEKCVTDAALTDKVWSKSGRLKFEDSGAAACISKATK